MIISLLYKSSAIFFNYTLSETLFSANWKPLQGHFGFAVFLWGTLWVTGLALILAAPVGIFTAIFLSEYAPAKIRRLTKPLIDLLASIPSVVFGLVGLTVIVPFVRDHVAPFLGVTTNGYCILSGGTILAIMILPIISHLCLEVFRTVPRGIKEAALALGATKWEVSKHVLLREAQGGIAAAILTGFARAFGETMAVLMLVGNVTSKIPHSIFDPAYPLSALIANNYGEMMSIPLYDAALMMAALLLLIVVIFFTAFSRLVLPRFMKGLNL